MGGTNSPMQTIPYSSSALVDTGVLNKGLDEVRTEFGYEIAAQHEALEHMAIKAGYVAVGVALASEEENALLLEILKGKEAEVARRHKQRPSRVAAQRDLTETTI